jgi:glutathione S-transferase
MMKLLGTETSPYARKARLVLLEKNIPHDYTIAPPREPGSGVARINPLGRIPALVLDDETCIFDSAVITEYADTLNNNPVLIPRDALARMRVKRWEALADGIMDAAVMVRTESLRPGEHDAASLLRNNDAISRALAYSAELLGEHAWCEGVDLTLADLALVSALIYLDLRQAERNWRSAHPNLATWFLRISARPSVKASLSSS